MSAALDTSNTSDDTEAQAAALLAEKKQQDEVLAASTSNYVYIRSDEHGWIPARVLELDSETGNVKVSVPQYKTESLIQSDGGKKAMSFETQTIQLKDYPHNTLLLQNVDEEGQLNQVEDMVDLAFLHEVRTSSMESKHAVPKKHTLT